MLNWLTATARTAPDTVALITDDVTWTYRDLELQSAVLAAWLWHEGVRRGDAVGCLLGNGAGYVALVHALVHIGAVLVPLNTRLTKSEIAYQIKNSGARFIITEDEHSQLAPDEGHVLLLNMDAPPSSATIPEAVEISLDSPFAIIHTSGTSGQPKGAVLTYGNVFFSATASAFRVEHRLDDRWLCVLPLYHVGGLSILIRACLYGITVELHRRFDTDAVNNALATHPVTLVSLVPTMLYRLLNARTIPWNRRLRMVLLGGAAATPELMQRCIDAYIPVATTYGLTEAASQVTTTTGNVALNKPGSSGKPLMFAQVRIVDENGSDRLPGEYGEVLVRGPMIMREYINDPDATAAALKDGWLHTGDIGYLDDDGDLWLVQRRSDLIVSGGENVYPAEVEDVLRAHPSVTDAAVFGLDHPEWGQQVAALVVRQAGHVLTTRDLTTYVRRELAGFKVPRQIKFVDALPQTASGKIQRAALPELFNNTR